MYWVYWEGALGALGHWVGVLDKWCVVSGMGRHEVDWDWSEGARRPRVVRGGPGVPPWAQHERVPRCMVGRPMSPDQNP